MCKIIAVSDLHDHLPALPPCDLLLLGGDYNVRHHSIEGQRREFQTRFFPWLQSLPAKEIVWVAGNHDFILEDAHRSLLGPLPGHYLQDSGVELFGLKIWGTPWTPTFGNWAFMQPDRNLAQLFKNIPKDTDILLSHGPPFRACDRTMRGDYVGSESLSEAIKRVMPNLVVCGHIHEAQGFQTLYTAEVCNVSFVDEYYDPRPYWLEIDLT